MALWLGMSKLGSVTALINTYIRDSSLVHTLQTVKAKGVMFTSETEKSKMTFSKPYPLNLISRDIGFRHLGMHLIFTEQIFLEFCLRPLL